MHRAVLEYDRTVSYVEADLLLLNIARARHHRPVHFTAVSSVAATFDFRTNVGIRGGIGPAGDATERALNLEYSASVAENPTITIIPIAGEEFTKRILRPLDESHVDFLVRQGFDIGMVLRLMARGIAIDRLPGGDVNAIRAGRELPGGGIRVERSQKSLPLLVRRPQGAFDLPGVHHAHQRA